ncbi:hypothetical protein QBC47DRAFT_412347 [Echria macrotheca]|uniref:Protein kinase domain-containing protein n=1 Tax=Echria macrotheca TaxID=438768 RepID=A0AAJ0F6L7_9PEZI|nr:hypothetical protein QBC47DRAFT_412347 [Echria macrotheca]
MIDDRLPDRSPLGWGIDLMADDLSPVMLETDPRICRYMSTNQDQGEESRTAISISPGLVLRNGCTKHETDIFELAGDDLATPLFARVGRVSGGTMTFHQTAAVFSSGRPFALSEILPGERRTISLQLTDLVSRLHAKGIIHGNINPAAIQWNSTNQPVFSDLSSARLVDKGDNHQNQTCWDGDEGFISPQLRSNTRPGRCFVPTESDDLYALAVTIWCVWACRQPEPGMFSANGGPIADLRVISDPDIFGDVVETLQQGGLNLDPMLSRQAVLRGRELSPPTLARVRGQDSSIRTRSYSPQSHKKFSISPDSRAPSAFGSERVGMMTWGEDVPPARHSPIELPAEVPATATATSFTIHSPLVTMPPPAALRQRRNSFPPSLLHPVDDPTTSSSSAPRTCPVQSPPQLKPPPVLIPPPTTNPHLRESSTTPPSPSSSSEDSSTSDSDPLDDEITWEFPFPFKQGLPCSPTDSIVCLASPRGPPPPDFAICLRPEQLNLNNHSRSSSLSRNFFAAIPTPKNGSGVGGGEIKHPRVQSMISLTEELDRVDALDRRSSVGRRWDAVNRARTGGPGSVGRTRSLSRGVVAVLADGKREGWR